MAVVEVFLLGAVGYVAFIITKYRKRAIGTVDRPDAFGPPAWPLLGNLPWVIKNSGNMLEHHVKLKEQYGFGVSLTFPFMRLWDISRPDWIEHIQKTNFDNYIKGSIFGDVMGDVLGEGIFAVDGSRWALQRRTTVHIFNARNFKNVISPSVDGCLATMNQIVSKHADDGTSFDFQDLCFRLTLESFSHMAFGQTVGALTLEHSDPLPFAVAFDYAQTVLINRFDNVLWWRFFERFNAEGRKMREACKVIDEYAYRLIDTRLAGAKDLKEKSHEEMAARDLLDLYMDARDEYGQRLSRQRLRDAVLSLIIAGRDTTAQALSWTFWHLIRDKRLISPLREEIDRGLGTEQKVTYDNYKSLVQVQAAFSEGLRLHPSVPKNVRFAIKDDVLPNCGPQIRAGDALRWSDWQMARDPEIWGEDCCEFRPGRFIDDSGRLKQYGQWKAHMFNGGPRICLGMNLATFEAVAVMVELIRNFDLDFAPGWWDSVPKTLGIVNGPIEPMYASSLTLPMKAPMLLTARRR